MVDSSRTPSLIRIHQKTSKTDPFYSGSDIFITATKGDLCPDGALLLWLVRHGKGPSPLFLRGTFDLPPVWGKPYWRLEFSQRVLGSQFPLRGSHHCSTKGYFRGTHKTNRTLEESAISALHQNPSLILGKYHVGSDSAIRTLEWLHSPRLMGSHLYYVQSDVFILCLCGNCYCVNQV